MDGKTYYFPHFDPPAGKNHDDMLKELATEGLKERMKTILAKYPDMTLDQQQAYFDRLETELDCIRDMKFPAYFLIVSDFIRWAKDRGIPVGPGRGSAAGSLVAYAIKITDLDPLPYNLLFERFLNPERISMPDIDVDFCQDRRGEVIQYMVDKYGRDRVCQIITFGTMGAKAVVRDVGRALNMTYGDVDRIAKLIPDDLKMTLGKALQQEPQLKELAAADPQVKDLLDTALCLEGLTRHASTHAAAVVVAPDQLEEFLPLYKDQKTGSINTQYSMKYVELVGLVKFDFLGLKNLTVIENAVKLVRAGKDPNFDITLLRDDDQASYDLITAGNTTGVFQLESSGMKEMLVKLKPSCFEDVIAACALYRPGPLGCGMVDDFIERKHGRQKVAYDLPQLEPILKDTYGVIVYQEQVMQISRSLAGYSLGQADLLRRAMGKKDAKEMERQKDTFLAGAKGLGIDTKKAEAIFDQMAKFAEYGFNKSHSAAYALIAYQTAYLKAHYPVEFMAALLTCDMDNTDKVIKNISDCREQGIEVLPPDVNKSGHSFTVVGASMRFGLGAVKGVGTGAVEAILEARGTTPFTDLFDFCERVDMRRANKKVLEALIKCGAFDSTGSARAALMEGLEQAMSYGQKIQEEKASAQVSLFGTEEVARGNGTGGMRLRTRDRDLASLSAAAETRRLVYLVQWLLVFSLALFWGLSFFSEQTAVWHMTAVRDTDFTPSNIITFYIAYPLFAIIGLGAFFYAKTRLPTFAKGYSLAFVVLVVGVFMTIPNVGFNEWGHTFWAMDEGFAGPLHWGFVFFGWMSLATFGVVLLILGRLRELLGGDALEQLYRR